MPYKDLDKYTSVRILKKVYSRVKNYAEISDKPFNVAVMQLLDEGLKQHIVDNS